MIVTASNRPRKTVFHRDSWLPLSHVRFWLNFQDFYHSKNGIIEKYKILNANFLLFIKKLAYILLSRENIIFFGLNLDTFDSQI